MNWLNRLIVTLAAGTISAASIGDEWLRSIPEFELTDHLGEVHTLGSYQAYDFVVFYVQGVGCPIARIALPNYRAVRDEFADKNIEFTMFNSNIQDNLQNRERSGRIRYRLPIMKDEGQHGEGSGVERTAEVFIVNPRSREVLFRGPINDQLGYETQRNEASEHYLKMPWIPYSPAVWSTWMTFPIPRAVWWQYSTPSRNLQFL